MCRLVLLLVCSLAGYMPLLGQGGFFIPQHARHVDLPFEYSNNFIILTLNCNGLLPLKFIFDTGAEHTVISKREITDAMRLTYEHEYRMKGSDLKTELIAYLVRRVRLEMPDKVVAPALDILVLQEDYFRFEEYAGVNVHGILAAGAFSKYFIKINYQRRVMTLYEREGYSPQAAGFTALPVQVLRNKPYFNTALFIRPETQVPVKLLLDTGAGLSLLLFTNTDSLLLPPPHAIASNIGMGLGGFLEGYTGRIHSLHLGDFRQNAVITYFQTFDSTQDLSQLNQRNGLIGNVLLDRFQVVFDYMGERIWLKPTKTYREAYVFDRSGMNIIAAGDNFNMYTINHILPASPAAEAGLQRGDVLLKVGKSPTLLMSLSDVQRAFQKEAGKKVRVMVRRNGTRIKAEVVLRELL